MPFPGLSVPINPILLAFILGAALIHALMVDLLNWLLRKTRIE